MASKLIQKINNGLGEEIVTFLAESIADIATVSTEVAVGSNIICLENKKKYILSTTRVWTIQ